MGAQCCICADLFENSANINIAAVPCGHTFHEECLMRWLETSSTCPSCRKQVKRNQIIRRLFFDSGGEEVDVSDPSILLNEISSLKVQVSEHASAKKELAEARDALEARLGASLAEKDELKEQIQKEQQQKLLLRKAVATAKQEMTTCEKKLAEFASAQQKLKSLESIELMLEGSEQDTSDMIGGYSDGGEATLKQLSSMVCVVKREYNKSLEDKRALRNHIKKLKNENIQIQIKMDKLKQEEKKMQLQLQKCDEDVFSLEQENNANKRKIARLLSAFKHKTEGSQSFIAAVNEESPNVAYTPPPTAIAEAAEDCSEGDSNASAYQNSVSPDLFKDSQIDISETTRENNAGSQIAIPPKCFQMVHISSAAEKFQAAKRVKIEKDKNAAPSVPFSNFSILQKKFTGLSNSRAPMLPKSRAYNGLGGSVKAEEPLETPVSGFMRSLPSKRKVMKKRNLLSSKIPPNQQKLMQCLPKSSAPTACTASVKSTANKEPCVKAPAGGVINLSSSSIKGSLSTTSCGPLSSSTKSLPQSSSSLTHLSCPSPDFIDLT